MHTLDLDSTITLTDGDYTFVEKYGSMHRLRSVADGSIVDMHIGTITQKLVGMPAKAMTSPRVLETVSAASRKKTMTMADHLREIETGINPGLDTPRAQYDLATTSQNERIDAKISELRAQGLPASRPTLMRKLKTFREAGSAALVDKRSIRSDSPTDRINPAVKDALCLVIADQLHRSTGTKSRIIRETQSELLKRYGTAAPAMPPRASLYRYIDALSIGTHITGSAKTRQSLANRPDRTFAKRIETLPGGEIQIDATTLDILIKTPSGTTERPVLTIMIDRATRLIIAYTLRLTGTKGVDHASLLANALTPSLNRPDRSSWRAEVQLANPQVSLLGVEERERLESQRPYVFPRRIMMDNGRDFISEVFMAAAEKFGIDVTQSAPHTPTGKPLVERMFGSIETLFTQYLPGYVGRSPEHRGHKVENEQLVDIYALNELFDDWVVREWNHRPHTELRDRMYPALKQTPIQAFAAAAEITSSIELTLTREDYIDMLPTEYRKITATGVKLTNRDYDSEELHPLRNTKSSIARKNGKWEVKYDPYNPQLVWVHGPDGTWIECADRTAEYSLHPHTSAPSDLPNENRHEVVLVQNTLAGTPLHLPITTEDDLIDALALPDFEDNDDDALPTFDPEKD